MIVRTCFAGPFISNEWRNYMKKTRKWIGFVVALLCNTAFLLLCGYGRIHHLDTATYWDPFLGVIAVFVLACGNLSIAVQLYFRSKYRHLKRWTFDRKFWRQCIVMAVYYAGSVFYLSVMMYEFMSVIFRFLRLQFLHYGCWEAVVRFGEQRRTKRPIIWMIPENGMRFML